MFAATAVTKLQMACTFVQTVEKVGYFNKQACLAKSYFIFSTFKLCYTCSFLTKILKMGQD